MFSAHPSFGATCDAVGTMRMRQLSKTCSALAVALLANMLPGQAFADRIENGVAVFSALDKVTARISKFKVGLGETATFGALKVTPRVCYSRPPTEQPKTTTFVEVDEVQLDGSEKRYFTGWMFAESPGLYGVEHPTFDVWLTECEKPLKTTVEAPAAAANAAVPRRSTRDDMANPDAGTQSPAAVEGAPVEPDPGDVPPEFRRRVRR